MPGLSIIGTGRFLPGRPYTNHDLARVLDTNDAWIQQRTGIRQRHFCPIGQGASHLALPAAREALASARLGPEDIDYILFNTMTPDHVFPGSGPLLGAALGCTGVPALDLRTQCAAMLFAFQTAEALLVSGAARRILIVGAEAHASVMPWRDWDILSGEREGRPSEEDWKRASDERGWSIIFGDGAGAIVVERAERPDAGILAMDLHTDGRYAEQLCTREGFRVGQAWQSPPFIHMAGRDVFKHAVTKLPRSIEAVCQKAGVPMESIDWFVAHQANQRINEAVCERLGVTPEKMPSNIDRYGNTSAATIPILLDEMNRDGRLKRGQLVCMLALGAGFHWGSALIRY
ncbi:MAG TPA: beta-ketoacyl-ACP synthase III [Polyangiaceae bacterium]|nr:beta-ketoacyl-ACP synthase III [Polyangiaceae bacterium]